MAFHPPSSSRNNMPKMGDYVNFQALVSISKTFGFEKEGLATRLVVVRNGEQGYTAVISGYLGEKEFAFVLCGKYSDRTRWLLLDLQHQTIQQVYNFARIIGWSFRSIRWAKLNKEVLCVPYDKWGEITEERDIITFQRRSGFRFTPWEEMKPQLLGHFVPSMVTSQAGSHTQRPSGMLQADTPLTPSDFEEFCSMHSVRKTPVSAGEV